MYSDGNLGNYCGFKESSNWLNKWWLKSF
jgi:hypothetical protein